MGGLGAVLAGLEAILGRHGSFWCCPGGAPHPDSGAQRGAKMRQKSTRDGPKSKTKIMTNKETPQDRLGAVLGRSWVVLGAVLGPIRFKTSYKTCFGTICQNITKCFEIIVGGEPLYAPLEVLRETFSVGFCLSASVLSRIR